MPFRIALCAVLVCVASAGCTSQRDSGHVDGSSESGATATQTARALPSECTPLLRFKGVVYQGLGYTNQVGEKIGRAREAECLDVTGEGPRFTRGPSKVRVSVVRGYSPAAVLAASVSNSMYSVYVADTVLPAEREAIVRDLAK
ncbi:DUF6281 family protein [Nocardioides glacieisoli]|uniref:DUF6281 family protein n=1 Tax=Nocardioides glacieisoli TaxID=1168730 RepID=UPI0026D6B594